jgi:hypothetical protein
MKPTATLLPILLGATLAVACGPTDGGDGSGEVDDPGGDGDDPGGDGDDPGGDDDDPGGDGDGTGGDGDDDVVGAQHECYGIADDLGELFAIDRETGQATHICAVPDNVAEIDAISSHPTTGVYYYVSQEDAELGWFDPDSCEFHKLGDLEVKDLAGLSFHPETGVLYGGDELTNEIYRFGQDADGAPTPETTLVASVPSKPKAIAIQPGTNFAYVSDEQSLLTVDLETGAAGTSSRMSSNGIEAMFFTFDGALHGVVEKDGTLANHFVDIDPATGNVQDVGAMNPAIYPPGSSAQPPADDVEAMECNVGGACITCDDDVMPGS